MFPIKFVKRIWRIRDTVKLKSIVFQMEWKGGLEFPSLNEFIWYFFSGVSNYFDYQLSFIEHISEPDWQ